MPDDFYLRITKENKSRLANLLDIYYREYIASRSSILCDPRIPGAKYNAATDVIEELGLHWSRDKDGNHKIE